MKKQSKKGSFVRLKRNSATISILTYSLTLLVVKLLWLNSQEGRGLLGADGENYLEALGGLWKDGFFSNQGKLSYWPAGYPILMWPVAELSLNNLAFYVGAIQSVIFAICVSFFCVEISKSSLKRFTWPAMHLLNLSPTLSLNSVAIGYEVTSAVIFLLVIGLYLRQIRLEKNSVLNFENFLASFALAVSCFMQPRMILLAMGILIPFAIYHFRLKLIPGFLILSLVIVSFAPEF